MRLRLSRDIAMAIDDLSGAAQQIAGGNFAWRTPLRSNDQIGELTGSFNEMAASLEQFQKQEVTRLEFDSDLRMTQRVQEFACSLVRRQSCLGPLSPAAHCRRVRWVAIYMTSSI